eukprot:7811819-Pyramimonas_sp.AAC.1
MRRRLPAGARHAQGTRLWPSSRAPTTTRTAPPLTEEQQQERVLRAMRETAIGAFGGVHMWPRSS